MKRSYSGILFAVLILLLMFPSGAFAYKGGTWGSSSQWNAGDDTTNASVGATGVNDNNINTGQTISWNSPSYPNYIWASYLSDQTVNNVIVHSDKDVFIVIYGNSGAVLVQQKITGPAGKRDRILTFQTPLTGVRKITLDSYTSPLQTATVYEFDFNADLTPPLEVNTLSANDITSNSVNLVWTNPTDATRIGFNIYDGSTLIRNLNANNYQQTLITGLNSSTAYTFTVKTYDANGNESTGKTVSFTTVSPPDTTPPDTPAGLSGTPGNGSVALSWTPSLAGDLAGYNLYLNGSKVNGSLITGTSYTAAAPNNQNNTWRISAVDTNANESGLSAPFVTHYDTISPIAPLGLTATKQGTNGVLLTWTPNSEPDLGGYSVYENSILKTGSLLTQAEYTISGLSLNTSYEYQVTASDTSGNESPKSSPITFLIGEAPGNVTTSHDNGTVTVSWSAIPSATAYKVYRNGVPVATVTGSPYEDTGLTNGQLYSYQVTAMYGTVEGDPSAPVTARPGKDFSFGDAVSSELSALDAIKTAFSFVGKLSGWVILVLGVLIAPVAIWFVLWLFYKLRPKQEQPTGKRQRTPLSSEEKERRARERKLNKARDDKYDLLTRTGRISERDKWIKDVGYLRPEQRKQRALEERSRKAREKREKVVQLPGGGREQRGQREGRGRRNGRN